MVHAVLLEKYSMVQDAYPGPSNVSWIIILKRRRDDSRLSIHHHPIDELDQVIGRGTIQRHLAFVLEPDIPVFVEDENRRFVLFEIVTVPEGREQTDTRREFVIPIREHGER